MNISFRINYYTRWGENIRIHYKTQTGDSPVIATMIPADHGNWIFDTETRSGEIFYRYEFVDVDGNHILEKEFRYLSVNGDIVVNDIWRSPQTAANALYSKVFTQAVYQQQMPRYTTKLADGLVVRLREIRIGRDEAFCLVSQQHGNWDTQKPYIMNLVGDYTWECRFTMPAEYEMFTFKFGLWDTKNGIFKGFEDGDNHCFEIIPSEESLLFNIDGFRYSHFWRGAGVAVPVFSLRSSTSAGCGEFADLMPLADWCVGAGIKMIQLLPINDTIATFSWVDTYPYNAISVMAFHPMFVNVAKMFEYYSVPTPDDMESEIKELNNPELVDYEKTIGWKLKMARQLFANSKNELFSDVKFIQYQKENAWWINDYAVFSVLRDKFSTPDFRQWSTLSDYDPKQVGEFLKPDSNYFLEVWFYIFLQYHLQCQLEEAIEYAHQRSVAFKGDLPIGINPCSVEAWVEPSQFNFGMQAGAPPDFFSASGQNWGFPTYNWDEMKKDGYAWWQKRLGRMQQFFDAFRIDHILGFFRIWSIPKPFRDGIMGHFEPSLPMGTDELRRFGFFSDAEYFSLPVCDRSYIDELCGSLAEAIDSEMFVPTAFGHRRMKSQFFNPREVEQWVDKRVAKGERARVRHGVEMLMREILFIKSGNCYWHPRIMLTESRLFGQLSAGEQKALRSIHDHYFYHRHNEFWKRSAIERLEGTLQKCDMLVCGEDLGMIPASVPEVMKRLQILSLEIQRMPKEIQNRYGDTWRYPYLSVCTPSTHDISSLRGWWEENPDETQHFFNCVLHRHGAAPGSLTPELAASVIEMHLQSPSMWCIVPLQDIAAIDDHIQKLSPGLERINEPANPRHYWRYRIPFLIDDIENVSTLAVKFKRLIDRNRR
jgi:4-alpha-glucanotransferase